MPTIKALADQGRAIMEKQRNLLNDDERPWSERKPEFDNMQLDYDTVAQQHNALKAVEGDPFGGGNPNDDAARRPAMSLGQHFASAVGAEGFSQLKHKKGTTLNTAEFNPQNAASDPNLSPAPLAPYTTEFDPAVSRGYRRAAVSDLFGVGALGPGSNSVSYPVEGAVTGGFTGVAEGGQKPFMNFGTPTIRTDAAKKIAGIFDTSDEMIEDLDFWVSEINERGLYLLSIEEERQLVSGSGTGAETLGLLNRSGVQAITQGSGETVADTIFRGMTAVQTATGFLADGTIINPVDYMGLRLNKDANGQYYGGGYFAGLYGVGGVQFQPPVWGENTVVSAATAAKTVVTGALKIAATVYRKGGVRVETTNSDGIKFELNLVTTRIEERVALASRYPAAVVKITLL